MSNLSVDTAKLPLMLTSLRLPTFARLWPELTQRADRESWPRRTAVGGARRTGTD